ncbi:MAG TPA: dihydrolipoyl dehydrogenase [Methylomirabilota bacterium]|nr:dihydrolipoyl dehydrogenase [Methylomirabilota bacterium]
MAAQSFDVVVVGTGPGGYVAAIRCAQLGLSVATVEDDRPGGVCLNWGCIPTKALLRNAEVVHLFQRAEEFGIAVGQWKADYAQAVQRSRRVADRMAKGVEFLFRKNKITLFPGRGALKSARVVEVAGKEGAQILEARRAVILATGSEPKSLPGVTIDEKRVVSSTGAVTNESRPGSLIVIGAGAVGIEFADVYAAYGTSVTVLEALPRVLPVEDEEVSAQIARLFSRRGITIRTGVRVKAVTSGGSNVAVAVEAEGKTETLTADQVLMAVGRGARTRGLGLEALSVATERGFVTVSPTMETSVKGIYAIGDMAGHQLLAHKAMAEGVVAAEAIAGQSPRPVDYGNVPSCTYCRPQVASIGVSEAAARSGGREIAVGKFPFTASGKAVALGETDGFVKVVADKSTGEILGVHIVGPEATELIHEFAVGRTLEATLEEIIHTIHAHPTLSEAALEATLAALGHPIHI